MALGDLGLEFMSLVAPDPVLFLVAMVATLAVVLWISRVDLGAASMPLIGFLWAAGQTPISDYGRGFGQPFTQMFWIITFLFAFIAISNFIGMLRK